MSEQIGELRRVLDEVDACIVDALVKRLAIVSQIGQSKLSETGGLRDLGREEELLAALAERGRAAGLDGYFVTRVFREILDQSLRMQQELLAQAKNPQRSAERVITVGFQGTEGAYSHLAASRHFGARGARVEYRGYDTFREMLEAVRDGALDYAMLPIENTTAGSINEAYDLLARMNLALVGEEIQRVEHCLLALEPVPVSAIRRVYSHPQALTQCSEFLSTLTHCHVESFKDTAMAAQRIREEQNLSEAAIASEEAARLYGLHVIKRDIANQKENFTRFVVVAAAPVAYDGRVPCKTSLIFATRHEEGALLNCLNIFHAHELNLTKLESRPRPNAPWEYLFYVDFEGNIGAADVDAALRELASRTSFLKVLGSYPSRTAREAQPAEPRRRAVAEAAAAAVVEPEGCKPVPASIMQMLEKAPYKLVSRARRMEDTQIRVGPVVIGGPRPVVIAGPCSVESREQIMTCARVVKECGGELLRGGCFKPRTSPYAFQGHGYDALEWLEEAGRAYGLPIVTEVLHPADIEKVARKADIIQIGARNMQNFALLKELGNVDRPILFKRGMMASVDEWLGAAEYILAHGNQQVILCERGIRTFETATRNTLDLSAIPVVRERTHLPIIVDPSHAAGTWRWVSPLTEAALACGAHGVMVEIHPEPEKALSDGPQALKFDTFARLMDRVHVLLGRVAEAAGEKH